MKVCIGYGRIIHPWQIKFAYVSPTIVKLTAFKTGTGYNFKEIKFI
jgi:hypothetical protein